jgi:hypothetical protein
VEELFAALQRLSREDDTVVRVVGMNLVSDDLHLVVALGTEGDPRPRESWGVVCVGPRAHRVSFDDTDGSLHMADEHVLLLPHRAPSVQTHFRNEGCDHARALAALYARHRALVGEWFPFEAFLRPEVLDAPGGLAGQGPEPLMHAYGEVLRAHGYGVSHLNRRAPVRWEGARWVEETAPFAVLVVGRSYVVASDFVAEPPADPSAWTTDERA